jgi:L-serine dehydratase
LSWAAKKIFLCLWASSCSEQKENLPFHPNGMIFKALMADGAVIAQDYYSVGGGFVATQEDVTVEDYCIRTLYPCHHGEAVLKYCAQLGISFLI